MIRRNRLIAAVGIMIIILAAKVAAEGLRDRSNNTALTTNKEEKVSAGAEVVVQAVLPKEGILLPVKWGDIVRRLIEDGVIDPNKWTPPNGKPEERILVSAQNAREILNLLWAFGLGNKNAVLETGPMRDPRYGGAENFASTGGWTLSRGKPMDHYSKHTWVGLTPEQQEIVERVSKGIYRPCCNNSTYFPDCNHGMAMLGLLELLVTAGVSEEDMYRYALQVNAYWFPDTYLTIAKDLKSRGQDWEKADPKTVLGAEYSSASGYRQVATRVEPEKYGGGGSCGV